MVLALHSVVAMLVYAFVAWALARLVSLLAYRPSGGTVMREVADVHDRTTPPVSWALAPQLGEAVVD